jgi:hypothetical protein
MKQRADTEGRSDGAVKTAITERAEATKPIGIRREQSQRPTIEISDADYRSFCWPCVELEDSKDCKSRH